MKTLILSAALGLAATSASFAAGDNGLSTPIVKCTPVIAKNAEALKLDEKQQAILKDWLAKMPAKRKGFEAEVIAMRTELRNAIHIGAPKEDRMAMAEKIGAAETQLLMMRSNCADHWRGVLSEEQFAQMLKIASGGM